MLVIPTPTKERNMQNVTIRAAVVAALVGLAGVGCSASAPTTTDTVQPTSSTADYAQAQAILEDPNVISTVETACQELRRQGIVIDTPYEASLAVQGFQEGAGDAFTDQEAAELIGAGLGRYCPDRINL